MKQKTIVVRGLAVAIVAITWIAAQAQNSPSAAEESLPPRQMVIDVNAQSRSLYKIAIPNLLGPAKLGAEGAEVLRNDLKLSSLFEVLNPKSFLANAEKEGLALDSKAWTVVGAQGVVKGQITGSATHINLELKFYELGGNTNAKLEKSYRGSQSELRAFMHNFGNELLRILTGEPGAFGTRLAFARRVGPGRKDVYVADFDGANVGRVSKGKGVAMLPNFGPGGVWYSVLTKFGMFLTRAGLMDKPVIRSEGLNMGVTACNGRMVFSSTRHGNSEIYSAKPDGTDVRRLTNHPGIDISPACGPGGQLAFVSNRHGNPQIFVMDSSGAGVRRVTYRGTYNQTPAWCPKAETPLIAFTGRDSGFDVFTVNVKTGEYKRLTEGQGSNKDPAFSPDCRMVAFASSRGGIFISNPDGLNQQLVLKGNAETIRWSR